MNRRMGTYRYGSHALGAFFFGMHSDVWLQRATHNRAIHQEPLAQRQTLRGRFGNSVCHRVCYRITIAGCARA